MKKYVVIVYDEYEHGQIATETDDLDEAIKKREALWGQHPNHVLIIKREV